MLAQNSSVGIPERPRARPDLNLQEVGEEGLLYDREGAMVHILNQSALFTWGLCDGSRSLDDIAAALAMNFRGVDGVSVRQDVERILSRFVEQGLLDRT